MAWPGSVSAVMCGLQLVADVGARGHQGGDRQLLFATGKMEVERPFGRRTLAKNLGEARAVVALSLQQVGCRANDASPDPLALGGRCCHGGLAWHRQGLEGVVEGSTRRREWGRCRETLPERCNCRPIAHTLGHRSGLGAGRRGQGARAVEGEVRCHGVKIWRLVYYCQLREMPDYGSPLI